MRRINYFAHTTVAVRYARSRPYFHPIVIGRIKENLGLENPVALDVGCGTGHSTIALKAIASCVIGTEVSRAMLLTAPQDEAVYYVESPAEHLPFESGRFDLITVSMAFHWFDRSQFLPEVRRLLKPTGTLVIYNNRFLGQMQENPAYTEWHREVYLQRYPTPARNREPVTDTNIAEYGLRVAGEEAYTNTVLFTVEELASYLTTQSNIIAAVEEGSQSLEEITAWLLESLQVFFEQPQATLVYGGTILYLQPVNI